MIAALYLGQHADVDPDAVAVLDAAVRNGLGLARERGPILGAWTMTTADRIAGARAALESYAAGGSRFRHMTIGLELALGMPVLQAQLVLGAHDAARDLLAETTATSRRREFRVEPFLAQLEAQLALVEGRAADAEAVAHNALVDASSARLLPTVARCFERLAVAASLQGEHADAARLFGASSRVRDEALFRLLWPVERDLCDEAIAAARAALGDAAYQAAFDEGSRLTTGDAVAYAQRSRGGRKRPTLGWAALTPTERQVADLASEGRTNKEIAAQLLMGAETVKTHLSRVFTKLGVKNRTELARGAKPKS
jgi:DNA-binding CsgD family transcriptional regulator